MITGISKKLIYKLKRKSWEMNDMFIRGLEKLQHIPRNLEGHTCVELHMFPDVGTSSAKT